jgi:signal transduction histidine kinase
VASGIGHKFVNARSGFLFDASPFYAANKSNKPGGIDTGLLNGLSRADSFEVINPYEMAACQNGDWYYLNSATLQIIPLPSGLNRPADRLFCLDGLFCHFAKDRGLRFFRAGRQTNITIDPSMNDLMKRIQGPGAAEFYLYRKGDQVFIQLAGDIYQLRLDGQALKARLLFKDLNFLTDQAVGCMQYDADGQRLFIGTVNAGIFVVTHRNFHTLTFPSRDMNDNIVLGFEGLTDGKFVTGHGILNVNRAEKSLLFSREEIPDERCFYKAADHSIWFSRDHHLYQYDSSFARQLFMDTLDLDSHITSIQEDGAHTLWVSLRSALLKLEKGRLHYLVLDHPLLRDRRIQATAMVVPGQWWIATNDGLFAYNLAAGRMEEKPLLPGVYVRSIYVAKDSSIWLGTYGDGYYKYAAGKFISLPLDPRQYLATAHSFLEDDKGFFWISTDHGLFRIKKKDLDESDGGGGQRLVFYYFDKSSGLNTDEFNGGSTPSSLADRQRTFYFSSMYGLVYFNPDSIRCEWPDKPILIDRIAVDGSPLDEQRALRITPDFNQLVVDVTTPFYGSEANLQVEYKLNGTGAEWYPVGREGRILINRLPYGKYALMIRKRDSWVPDGFTVSSLYFEVLPKWYNTRGFGLALAGLILLALLMIYVFRPRILMLQNRRLQVKVDQRTAELEQSTLIKERLLSAIMHDLRSPLFAQGFMISYLEGNSAKLTEEELGDLLFQLNESNKKICQFSTDFLTWYNTRQEGFRLELFPLELEPFVREVADFHKELAERKRLYFALDIPAGFSVLSDKNLLAIVLRNLVDNAVKYTKAGHIHITAAATDGEVSITIKDTGAGMSAAKIDELLSHRQNNGHKANSTYGYRLIVELAQLIQAGLQIESEIGKGTAVTLSFRM